MTLWKIQTKSTETHTLTRVHSCRHINTRSHHVHQLCTLCSPQIFPRLSQTESQQAENSGENEHKTQAQEPQCSSGHIMTPSSQWQQPPSTYVSTLDTMHRPPLRSVADLPQSQQERTGARIMAPALIHIRLLSVTCGVQPKAKGHRGSAALYNVTLALANSQAISPATWELARGIRGRKRAG